MYEFIAVTDFVTMAYDTSTLKEITALHAGLSEQKKALRSKKALPGAKKRSWGQKKVLPGAPERSTFAERVIFSY
jgi:hypothetical protein